MTATTKAKTVKAADSKQDVFAIPGLPNIPAMEVPPAFRDMAETSVAQSKEAYDKFKTAAEDATVVLETAIEKTRDGVVQLNAKAMEVAQENTDAALSHVKNVFAVKTFSEIVELQTAYIKSQMNAMQDQTKIFQELTTKLIETASAPYKTAFEKSADLFKSA